MSLLITRNNASDPPESYHNYLRDTFEVPPHTASEIFQGSARPPSPEPVLEVEQSDEEPAAEPEPQPAPELSIQPIKKPKRQASAKQREHLARIHVKAAESRRKQATQKPRPATARSTPHPTFSDGDVDRLLDRYKERRKAKNTRVARL
eukprot:COSAG06_NODE_34_length_31045_cov_28.806469_5_plen_149_part_00